MPNLDDVHHRLMAVEAAIEKIAGSPATPAIADTIASLAHSVRSHADASADRDKAVLDLNDRLKRIEDELFK